MDEIAKYNKERWEELAKNNVEFSRPFLDLNKKSARKAVDPEGMLKEIKGKKVLCLAGGGGQQSAAFGLLGADVTVLDLAETQLERDRIAAKHYNLSIKTIQRDMRDLSCFKDDEFDIVWHAHSINFIPDARKVFTEVSRILKKNGLYRISCANPFVHGVEDSEWNGKGYPLRMPYIDGEVTYMDTHWGIWDEKGNCKKVKGPREFRHTLRTLVNGMISEGFIILGAWEDTGEEEDPKPGTWGHFMKIAPPYLTFWTVYQPDFYEKLNKSK